MRSVETETWDTWKPTDGKSDLTFNISAAAPRHQECVKHQVTSWREVQQKVNRLGDVAVGARDAFDLTPGAFEEKLHFERIRGYDGVVVRRERLLDDGSHAIEANRSGISPHLASLFEQAFPVI